MLARAAHLGAVLAGILPEIPLAPVIHYPVDLGKRAG
jgi:hypothetical protein